MKEKKSLNTDGMSTREKMLARKKKLAEKTSNTGFIYPKEGCTRVRLLSPGPNKELGLEVIRFYINKNSIFSPATFDEPCPFMEKYQELKNSPNEEDKNLAKTMVPSRRYVLACLLYKDDKGKELENGGEPKVMMVPASIYQDIIEYYLDEDEAGDMTDPDNGYDIKIERSGSGKFDTTYSVRNCKPTKLDKKLLKEVDLESMVKANIKSYDELERELNDYLNQDSTDSDNEISEDDRPKDKKKKDKKKKKKAFKSDI